MKKILSSLFVLLAATLLASAAYAGNIRLAVDQAGAFPVVSYVPVDTTQYMYPAEAAVKSVTVDFATGLKTTGPTGVSPVAAVGKSIFYTPTTNLPSATRIRLTLTNGFFPVVPDLFLVGMDPVTTVMNSLADYDSTDTSVPGQTTYTFIVGTSGILANEPLFLSTSKITAINPLIAFNGSNLPPTVPVSPLVTPGAAVTLSVQTVEDSFGPIAGGLASAEILIQSYQQFSWNISAGTGDIEIPFTFRRLFTDPPPGFPFTRNTPITPGTVQLQDYSLTIPVTTGFRIDLTIASLARLNYTITGAQLSKLSSLVLDPTGGAYGFTVGLPVPPNSPATDLTTTIVVPSGGGTNAPNSGVEDIIFTVDGVSILNLQTFNLATLLDFQDVSLGTASNRAWFVPAGVNGSGPIMQWTMQTAWQGTIPYLFASTDPAQDAFVKLFNNSDALATVYVDVYPDLGNPNSQTPGPTPPPEPRLNVLVPNTAINPQGAGIIWGSAIAAAAGLPDATAFAVVLTVDVRNNLITGVAVQKRLPAGDRVLPIYTGSPGFFGSDYKHY